MYVIFRLETITSRILELETKLKKKNVLNINETLLYKLLLILNNFKRVLLQNFNIQ